MDGKKVLFSFALVFTFFTYSADLEKQNEYTSLIIQIAQNLSSQQALIGDKKGHVCIPSSTTISLERDFKIPFISIKHYMKEYIKNIPYAPKDALKVKTQQGLLRIWESEAGVVCAPDPKEAKLGTEWETNTLLKVNNQGPSGKFSAAVLRLFLLINKHGEVSLKRLGASAKA